MPGSLSSRRNGVCFVFFITFPRKIVVSQSIYASQCSPKPLDDEPEKPAERERELERMPADLTQAEKDEFKRVRNRRNAKRMRTEKKEMISSAQELADRLHERNDLLLNILLNIAGSKSLPDAQAPTAMRGHQLT